MPAHLDPDRIRSVNPSTLPQVPFDDPPHVPERSEPRYEIDEETLVRITMRDGVRLAADVFRPSAAGRRFPALLAVSPYSRQLQRTPLPQSQNEAGLTEFWVPRGYAHVVIDVRGSNDSEGSWDNMGPTEQQDLFDLVEWAAEQPWCDGRVGMVGCSYFGWSQLMAATLGPPHLKAIFAFDATVDAYRERYFHGGIFRRSVDYWFSCMASLNLRGERLKDASGMRRHMKTIMAIEHEFDGPYYRERLSWPRLGRIRIPTYFACDWEFHTLHLRGAFEGWMGVGSAEKKMLIGPKPRPGRPMGAYHLEALRWYDHHLKGMDTRVMDGPPIQLYIQGEHRWRGEREWPIARTEWRELYLGGESGSADRTLLDRPGADGQASYDYDPSTREAYLGGPRVVYRSEPLADDLEVTGPLALTLWAASTASDTDWYVRFLDEAPGGATRVLTLGWLRASHRELDAVRSTPWRPFHPHERADPLVPGEVHEFAIELWPTSNLFRVGHRLRLELASCDDQSNFLECHQPLVRPARNTVLEGRAHPSRLLLPVIPRQAA